MDAVPPKISPARPVAPPGMWLGMVLLGIIGMGVAAVVFCFNPATHHFYPVCQFHRLTGLNCPGCGMTRALYALLHGDFITALHDNALFVAGMIAVPARWLWLAVNKPKGRPVAEFLPVKLFWPLLFLALIFTILRNLPAFAFLSPT